MSKIFNVLEKNNVKLNAEQKEAVLTLENTVVTAGAGSGKTTVLAYRFLRLVLDEFAKCDEILTLTFTKKAANEMYERIYKLLVNEKLDAAVYESLTNAVISTQDSFLSTIVKTSCVQYGLTKDFQIGYSTDIKLETLIDKFLTEEDNTLEAHYLFHRYNKEKLRSEFFYPLYHTYYFNYCFDAKEYYEKERERASECFDLAFSAVDNALDHCLAMEDKNYDFYNTQYDNLHAGNFSDLERIGGRVSKDIAPYRDIYNDNYYLIEEYKTIAKDKNSILFYSACEKFLKLIKDHKGKRGILSFDDVSQLAYDILKNNREIRTYFKKKFKYIMIDEFQDNNELQKQILFFLAEKEEEFNESPSFENLDPFKLFFVGDVKQSIYLFRGADVSVFKSLENNIPRVINMDTNYRSSTALINYFNDVFSKVLVPSSPPEAYEADYQNAISGRNDKSKSEIVFAYREKDESDSQEAESEYIASLIKEITSGSNPDYYVDGKIPRAKDIAILYRTKKISTSLQNSFRNHDIAYVSYKAQDWILSDVFLDFQALLQILVYPDDKLSYLAFLKSPFVKLSDGAISLYNKGVDFTLFDSLSSLDREKMIAAELFYNDIKEKSKTYNILELLDTIFNSSGYSSYILANESYIEYEASYDGLYYFASQLGENKDNIANFLFNMNALSLGSSEIDTSSETKLTYDQDAVSLMTIHGSKGLEFPIVIIADIARGDMNNNYPGSFFTQDGKVYTSAHAQMVKDITSTMANREAAELKRVLYVAITRSKNHIITTASVKYKKDGALSSGGKLFNNYIDAIMDDRFIPKKEKNNIKFKEFETKKISSKTKSFKFPAAEEVKAINYGVRSLAVSGKEDETDLDGGVKLQTLLCDDILKKYEASNLFGTYVHALLESFMKKIDKPTMTISKDEKETIQINNDAENLVSSFLASDLYTKYIEGSEVESELNIFTFDSGYAYEGIVDLVVFKEDYNIVVDYKTDSYKVDQKHKGQVKMYLKAVEDIYSKPAYGMVYYLREANPVVEFIDKDGLKVTL